MLLKSLDKGELKAAFLAEESQQRRHPEGPSGDAALFTSSATCHCRPGVTCYFCEQPGHCTHKCQAFKQAKVNAKANQGCPRHHKHANKASEATASSSTPSAPSGSSTTPSAAPTAPGNAQNMTQSAQSVTEFTGNASLRSFDSSDPLCPLQLDACADWNVDIGATSHMTPHCHWL